MAASPGIEEGPQRPTKAARYGVRGLCHCETCEQREWALCAQLEHNGHIIMSACLILSTSFQGRYRSHFTAADIETQESLSPRPG